MADPPGPLPAFGARGTLPRLWRGQDRLVNARGTGRQMSRYPHGEARPNPLEGRRSLGRASPASGKALAPCSTAFSSREPVPASLEDALEPDPIACHLSKKLDLKSRFFTAKSQVSLTRLSKKFDLRNRPTFISPISAPGLRVSLVAPPLPRVPAAIPPRSSAFLRGRRFPCRP